MTQDRSACYDLIKAAADGDKETLSQLLQPGGADVNLIVTGQSYVTALMAAAREGHRDTVSLLLDRGADVNLMATRGMYGTALIAAASRGHQDTVLLLMDKGADVNLIATGGMYGTALIAAAREGHRDTVSLLLDRRADINLISTGPCGTALIAAAYMGQRDTLSLLMDRGADVNIIAGRCGTALITAVFSGKLVGVSLLLDRGADVNLIATGADYETALIAAAHMGHQRTLSLLMDRGADVNLIVTGRDYGYGTALIAAAYMGHQDILSLLMDRGADVNLIVTRGDYRTALIAAASMGHQGILSLLMDKGADVNLIATGADYETALIAAAYMNQRDTVSLLMDRGADVNIISTVGRYGTALIAAAYMGYWNFLSMLIDRGADVNLIATGRDYGTALMAAAAADMALRGRKTMLLLLDRGADVNAVACKKGSLLAQAAYQGDEDLVTFLLSWGADPFHVGGEYKTAAERGNYPTALDAAQSGKADPALIVLISSTMAERSEKTGDKAVPPFPLPYVEHDTPALVDASGETLPLPSPRDSNIDKISHLSTSVGSIWALELTAEHADLPCRSFSEEVLFSVLVGLVGIHTAAVERLKFWIQMDVRIFISRGYDLGLAYAAARIGWKHFNEMSFEASAHRAQWLKRARGIDEVRKNSIYKEDNTAQELIRKPYQVMPRRIWDVKSNRVVEFRMLHSEALASHDVAIEKDSTNAFPAYWAITHSWTNAMGEVTTSINQRQWPVPIPSSLELQHLREELKLLGLGNMYVWLDVLCLRQHSTGPSADTLNEIKKDEWKLDVPTIGNIYRAAEGLVRYFNGLGQDFVTENWDNPSPTHWLKRAWTLQEIKTEQRTINGGMLSEHRSSQIIMDTPSKGSGHFTTLRHAIRPVLKLAAVVDSPGGCSIYELAREMDRRHCRQSTDKVAGLLYLLRTTELPTYDDRVTDEDAWTYCFNVLPFARKIEILFDFPYSGTDQKWIPTWSQLLKWPELNPINDYTPTMLPSNRRHLHLLMGKVFNSKTSIFLSDIWAISNVCLLSISGGYLVKVKGRFFGFYSPYLLQIPVQLSITQKYTIVTTELGNSNHWLVCEVVRKEKMHCISGDPDEKGTVKTRTAEVEVQILTKLGVLRTDSGGELWLAGRDGSAVGKINALFV